ncbi:DUF134 domain-containing protein [Desulfovibrio litoralis]|uniref:UPF0251 protein SAMN02745728_00004 n=1 Tax=Desulfovibrio litoralis DSM 11393 TaxID=1121455 RepID=A0A1M7RQH3_9BACT|nr:DUF134 domain-containing protein [Desulfovibrio litoralis]SHN48545.1 Predicted DNA-binding protein, UPF0251 family [Desulfovibrio litoralis DSM 11393]
MSRPKKWRKVCCLPELTRFGPLGLVANAGCILKMSVEEYESIRLIDLEGMTQEECAENMHIARTTVQGIYNSARKKIAESLVNGKSLQIEGGQYKLCNGGKGEACCNGGCRKHQQKRPCEQGFETLNEGEGKNENSCFE